MYSFAITLLEMHMRGEKIWGDRSDVHMAFQVAQEHKRPQIPDHVPAVSARHTLIPRNLQATVIILSDPGCGPAFDYGCGAHETTQSKNHLTTMTIIWPPVPLVERFARRLGVRRSCAGSWCRAGRRSRPGDPA